MVKACRECKYYISPSPDNGRTDRCNHPELNTMVTNYVTGEQHGSAIPISIARGVDARCGHSGRLWEPKWRRGSEDEETKT